MKITYDNQMMATMAMFSKVTGAGLKDCFFDDTGLLTFIVEQGEIGKAIGKGGMKVRILEKSLNRKIKIVEFNPDALRFIKNLVFPVKIMEIIQEDKIIKIEAADTKSRGILIGRSAQNLRSMEKIVKRYFDIDEIKVI